MGRRVSLGPLALSLWGGLSLRAATLSIGEPVGAESAGAILVDAGETALHVAWLPLLRRDVEVRSVTAERINVTQDGRSLAAGVRLKSRVRVGGGRCCLRRRYRCGSFHGDDGRAPRGGGVHRDLQGRRARHLGARPHGRPDARQRDGPARRRDVSGTPSGSHRMGGLVEVAGQGIARGCRCGGAPGFLRDEREPVGRRRDHGGGRRVRGKRAPAASRCRPSFLQRRPHGSGGRGQGPVFRAHFSRPRAP